jgi:hypothetical protein
MQPAGQRDWGWMEMETLQRGWDGWRWRVWRVWRVWLGMDGDGESEIPQETTAPPGHRKEKMVHTRKCKSNPNKLVCPLQKLEVSECKSETFEAPNIHAKDSTSNL